MNKSAILEALISIVGREHVSTTAADRSQHGRDQSSHPLQLPDFVIWPSTTDEVSAIMRVASEHKLPIVGWGAGTSLEGNPIPTRGGIVVDFGRMQRIVAIHEQDFQVTVEPGLLYKDMNKVLARHGLFFAPDPGANASIGGMIANNAAGIRTVKYGATRDNVLALEVVLADGTVMHTGSRSVKQSAGYDLTHLIIGSEGTLGLVTQATLKLAPLPEHFSAVTAAFPSETAAAEAVFGIIGGGLNPGALEFLNGESIRVLNEEAGFSLPQSPNLFMEFSGASLAALEAELELVREICDDCGCLHFEAGLGLDARNHLWEARHGLFEVMVRHYTGCTWQVADVAVPISQYPALVTYASEAMTELQINGSLIGHAGDGNLHTAIFIPEGNEEAWQRAAKLNDLLVHKAISLDGTCTGEHGVGLGKQKYMELEHGLPAMTIMRQIKKTLDPQGLMNPGKVLGEAL